MTLFAAEQLDIVHICTPPQTHAPLALEALKAGVSLIEKPSAPSLREMRDARRRARRRPGIPGADGLPAPGTVLPPFDSATPIADGQPRPALVATCETQWYRDDEYFAVPWRGSAGTWRAAAPPSGHGIHQFDLLLSLLGPWRSLSAMAARQVRPTDTEDVSVARSPRSRTAHSPRS